MAILIGGTESTIIKTKFIRKGGNDILLLYVCIYRKSIKGILLELDPPPLNGFWIWGVLGYTV